MNKTLIGKNGFLFLQNDSANELEVHNDNLCKVDNLFLAPGRYRVSARILAGQDESDWLLDGVGYLDVEAGDFYGTGSKGYGQYPILLNGSWFTR